MTSSRRFLLFCRPTLRGMTVPGKTTTLRMGRMGREVGMLTCCPLPPILTTVASAVRSRTCVSAINFKEARSQKRRARSLFWLPAPHLSLLLSFLGQFDPEKSVDVGGGDALVDDVGGELDLAAEGAVVDLHDVDPEPLGVGQRGLHRVIGGWGGNQPRAAEREFLVGDEDG